MECVGLHNGQLAFRIHCSATLCVSPSVADCVAYLRVNCFPLTSKPDPGYNTPERLSQRLLQRGAYYAPETLTEAVAALGWPAKVVSGKLLLCIGIYRPLSVEAAKARARTEALAGTEPSEQREHSHKGRAPEAFVRRLRGE